MHTNSIPQAAVTGYANGPVTKAPNWHGLVAWDMLLNSLTTGLFLVAALLELTAPDTFSTVTKAAYPIALVLLLADLLCLVLDLGDPWRFHHMLRVFKPSSPMSLGTWCLTIYSLPLTVLTALAALSLLGITLEWAHWLAVITGLLPALGSAVYKGVLFSTSAQPAWKDARWLGGYLTNSALLLGCAMLLALSILMGQERAVAILRPALVLLLLLNVVALGLLLADVRAALTLAYTRRALGRVSVLALGGGVLVPLVLLAVGGPVLMLGAVLFIVLGALVVRYEIVIFPHVMGHVGEAGILRTSSTRLGRACGSRGAGDG